ncbi:hypothetical protein AB0442_17315 [Kitasatospora sp. NPDC085895]|uniref:hypothetical protein n=1 Tax=Kitasatospora sp. NPDC085895 TaxID=3155057 RepID=UPI0034503A76
MTDTPEALTEALRANDARPYGRSRTVTAEELAEAAEQFPDHRELQVLALMDLMEAYEYDGEARKAPVVFARILKLWDTHPDDFNEWARLQVFWRFKWVASALLSTPDVPLDAIRRWHDEMRSRYTAAGHGLQPYYAQRYHLAAHTGDAADDAFDLWATRPRSQMSDCTACEIRARARHHAARGDDARALREWQPVLGGESTCSEEPWTSHAWALLPLLREGRLDEARSSHLVGYRGARGKSSTASQIGLHLEFCALSGNEPRGLEILAENRGLFDGHGDPLARLGFLVGVEVLTARLAALGHGDLPAAGPAGRNWTVDTLHAHVAAEAEQSAARFDARNGTTAVGDHRRARLARTPLLDRPLALGVRAAGQVPAPAVAPVVRSTAEPVPEDFVALVLRARELDRTDHPDADALWARITTVVATDDHVHPDHPELGPAERLQGNLADHRAQHAFEADDWQTARTELLTAAELYESAGLPIRALVMRTRAAVAHLGEEDGAAPDWPALDEALRRADELAAAAPRTGEGQGGDAAEDRLAVVHSLTFAAYQELVAALPEPPTEVAARFGRLLDAYRTGATELGLPLRIAAARQYAADIAARQGRMAEAREGLETSIEQLERGGLSWRTPRPLGLLGQIELMTGEHARAAEVLQRAVAEAVRWHDTSFPYGPTYAMLGHACEHTGDAAGAVRALTEAADRFDRAGKAEDAAGARMQLASVLRDSGRPGDAVAVLESLLLETGADGFDGRARAQVRLDLARGLLGLEEYREAAEHYLLLADEAAGWEDGQDIHTMVACEATVALAEAGRWEAADTARTRALAAHAVAPRADQVCGMLQQLARLTVQARGEEGLDEALARLDEADEVVALTEADGHPVTSWYQRGQGHYERARCYAFTDRAEEGLAAAEAAVAAHEAGGADGEEPRAEALRMAALIEGRSLGRTDAARARLAEGVRRCERAGLPEAAGVLAALGDRLAAEAGR